jgi:hypothetical protein
MPRLVRGRWSAMTALLILTTAQVVAQAQPPPGQGNKELERLFKEDQSDPRPLGTPEQAAQTMARAAERRRQAAAILAADGAKTAADYYNVALLYQHSESPDDLLMAHVLSTIAGYKGDYRGRWLSAASLDKYLHRTDQLQVFGTQYFVAGDRRLNPKLLGDALRREFCVPSLAAQRSNDAAARGGARTWTRIVPECETGFVPGGGIPRKPEYDR